MAVLIWGLPPDSATRQAINQGKPLWSTTDYLLADLIDVTQYNTWAVANKDVPRMDQSKPPQPYPRPGMNEPKKAKITAAALLDFRERTKGR
ncbi:hypothetical protein [Streptomyces sp. NRRL S-31]|uniref:hypothetical protein n=1 Tax=Streptomyces sp. NRRL S-31 TaxID=1463898 RepID=UPI00069B9385|nr:hypothetical protein [Streptomyces sp. NRRL S-31]